jgi:hypothetical protein
MRGILQGIGPVPFKAFKVKESKEWMMNCNKLEKSKEKDTGGKTGETWITNLVWFY